METKVVTRRQMFITAGKVIAGGVVAGAFSLLSGGCAGGSHSGLAISEETLTEEQSRMVQLNLSNQQQWSYLVREVEPHLVRTAEGTVDLPVTRAVAISREAVEFANPVIEKLNAMIRAGEVTVDSHLTVRFTGEAATRAENVNAFSVNWWGLQWYLNNDRTNQLVNVATSGQVSTAGTLLTSFAGMRLAGSAASLVGALAALIPAWGYTIGYVNKKGGSKGVQMNVTWVTLIVVQAQPFV